MNPLIHCANIEQQGKNLFFTYIATDKTKKAYLCAPFRKHHFFELLNGIIANGHYDKAPQRHIYSTDELHVFDPRPTKTNFLAVRWFRNQFGCYRGTSSVAYLPHQTLVRTPKNQ